MSWSVRLVVIAAIAAISPAAAFASGTITFHDALNDALVRPRTVELAADGGCICTGCTGVPGAETQRWAAAGRTTEMVAFRTVPRLRRMRHQSGCGSATSGDVRMGVANIHTWL